MLLQSIYAKRCVRKKIASVQSGCGSHLLSCQIFAQISGGMQLSEKNRRFVRQKIPVLPVTNIANFEVLNVIGQILFFLTKRLEALS